MPETIDELQIKVEAASTDAASGIDKLSASLAKLKSAVKGGAGLTTTTKQFQALSQAMNTMQTPTEKIQELVTAFKPLESIGKTNLGSTVNQLKKIPVLAQSLNDADMSGFSEKLQSLAGVMQTFNSTVNSKAPSKGLSNFAGQVSVISRAVNSLAGLQTISSGNVGVQIENLQMTMTQISELGRQMNNTSIFRSADISAKNISTFVNALVPLQSLQSINLSGLVDGLARIPEITQKLSATDMAAFATQIQRVAAAMQPLAAATASTATVFDRLPAVVQKVISSNSRLEASNKSTAKSYGILGTGISAVWAKLSVAYFAAQKIGNILANWMSESNDYVEDLNLFTVALGDAAESAQVYAEKVSELLGIDPAAWLRNQGVFNTLLTGFGVVSDKSAIMSKNLTQLGYDLSSFFNISAEDAMQKLQSGISGELEPLRRLGYDLSQAKLQEIALSLGIDKKVASMNQAEKSQLRYYAILTQVTTAQGDMARTITSPANALRILSAQATQAARALGNIFIPVLNAVLPYAIAFLQVVREIANELAKLAGFSIPKFDYSGVGKISSNANNASDSLNNAAKAAKELKNQLIGIDELNILTKNSSADAVSTGNDLGIALPEYDFLQNVASQTDEIAKKIKSALEPLAPFFKGLGEVIGTAWDVIKKFVDTHLYKWLVDIGNWMKDHPKTLELLGKGLGYVVIGLLGFKLINWIAEITGVKKLLEWLLKLTGVTDKLTGKFNKKNDALGKQTVKTNADAEATKGLAKEAENASEASNALAKSAISTGEAISTMGERLGQIEIPSFAPSVEVPYLFDAAKNLSVPALDLTAFKESVAEYQQAVSAPIIEIAAAPAIAMTIYAASKIAYQAVVAAPAIMAAVAPAINASALKSSLQSLSSEVESSVSKISAKVSSAGSTIADNVRTTMNYIPTAVGTPLSSAASTFGAFFKAVGQGTVSWGTSTMSNFASTLTYIGKATASGLSNAGSNFVSFLNSTAKGFVSWGNNIAQNVGATMSSICQSTVAGLSSAWETVKSFFSAMGERISENFQAHPYLYTGVSIGLAALAIGSAVLSGGATAASIPPTLKVVAGGLSVLAAADGAYGIPNGQLFVAREAGPEMVGTIGGHTAVANNSQIVEGIAGANEGVITAVYSMASMVVKAIEDKDTSTYLDGKKVSRELRPSQQRQNTLSGRSLVNVGG